VIYLQVVDVAYGLKVTVEKAQTDTVACIHLGKQYAIPGHELQRHRQDMIRPLLPKFANFAYP
jgi:hypothetical protein